MYKLVKDYRDNDVLRHSFNELAQKTFGLDFEDWYRNGYWGENYNPYSIVTDDKIVANVSVNKTDMVYDGITRHFLQLGTVMTDEAYRNQGLIRKIMEQIEADYNKTVDGIYLFGNDNVVSFYPKFGFREAPEYQYVKKVFNIGDCQFQKIIMDNLKAWKQLENAMDNNVFYGKFDMVNNKELIMFYVTKFMQECVYYHKDTETYVIAEVGDGKLLIHNVFSRTLKELDAVIALFGKEIKEITLGFVPMESESYEVLELCEEDCTFFIKGEGLAVMEQEKLRIPSLAHA